MSSPNTSMTKEERLENLNKTLAYIGMPPIDPNKIGGGYAKKKLRIKTYRNKQRKGTRRAFK